MVLDKTEMPNYLYLSILFSILGDKGREWLLLISVVQLPELSPMPSKTAHKSLIGFLSLGFR